MLEWLSEGFRDTYDEAKMVCNKVIRSEKKREALLPRKGRVKLGVCS